MNRFRRSCWWALAATVAGVALAASSGSAMAAKSATHRYVVVMKPASATVLRATAQAMGADVLESMAGGRVLVVTGTEADRAALAAQPGVLGVGRDGIKRILPPERARTMAAQMRSTVAGPFAKLSSAVVADPAFHLPGLLWNYDRINAPSAWQVTRGSQNVTVAVADTGLDYTHRDLRTKIDAVVNFTTTEQPQICKSEFGVSDKELADEFGVKPNLDFNGHGSWIGGAIGAATNGVGTNGLAPNVRLVALKISQWCGSAYDSELISAFIWAADHGVDVVNISFGGFTDRSDPAQDATFKLYQDVAQYALTNGTTIVASAGNDHVRVATGGKVVSHGFLTTPGDDHVDPFGLYTSPGGVPGYVNVAATGRVVAAPSANCPGLDPEDPSATCKPVSDRHDSFGVGRAGPALVLLELRPGDHGRRTRWGAQVQPAGLGSRRHAGIPVHDGRRHERLPGVLDHVELRAGDPLRDVPGRERLPAEPVLLHDPGHVHGGPARGGRAGPDQERAPQLGAGAAGRQADGEHDPSPQPDARPGCRRHLEGRPDGALPRPLHQRLLPPGRAGDLRLRRVRRRADRSRPSGPIDDRWGRERAASPTSSAPRARCSPRGTILMADEMSRGATRYGGER